MAADDAYELAVEQWVYWRGIGLENREMLRAVGINSLPWWIEPVAEITVQFLAMAERERAFSAQHAHKLRAA